MNSLNIKMPYFKKPLKECAVESSKEAKMRIIRKIYDEDIILQVPHKIIYEIFNIDEKKYADEYGRARFLAKMSKVIEIESAIFVLPFSIKESSKNKYIFVSVNEYYNCYFLKDQVIEVVLFSAV